ncbi:tyrosine-type recombinase/integrase [Roseovarius confluentis]|uniref:tyrosine-type recombinase/integrase n=1 Tax=Roseovarius confluentis TaxID=1852027 RepID=UPI003BACAB85
MPKLKLSDKVAKGLQADPTKNVRYLDTETSGLALLVTKNGHMSFVFSYSIDGRERRMRIGAFPQPWSVRAARERAKELRRMVDQGLDPLGQRQEKAAEPTLKKLWECYKADHLPKVSAKYAKDQKSAWEAHVLPALGNRKLSTLVSHDIDVLHRKISKTAPVLANRTIASVRKALEYAIRRDWLSKNVAKATSLNREEGRHRYLSDDELTRFIAALDRMENQKAANAVRLLLLTGARRSEVFGARWEEFDLERALWTKPSARVKTRKKQVTPISQQVVELLSGMKSEGASEYLFPSRKGMPIQDIKRPWAWLMQETDLSGFRIHDLRHNHASILVSQGHSLELIGRLLGHTQASTTKRYAEVMQDPLRKALAGMDAVVAVRPASLITDQSKSQS